jgi:hypothetical protein
VITANLVNHYEPVISKNRQKQTKMCRNRPKWENSGRVIRIRHYSSLYKYGIKAIYYLKTPNNKNGLLLDKPGFPNNKLKSSFIFVFFCIS